MRSIARSPDKAQAECEIDQTYGHGDPTLGILSWEVLSLANRPTVWRNTSHRGYTHFSSNRGSEEKGKKAKQQKWWLPSNFI
jgi:hypothetical protein